MTYTPYTFNNRYVYYLTWKWNNKKHKFLKQYYVLNFNSKPKEKVN